MKRYLVGLSLVVGVSVSAFAAAAEVVVDDAWVRATVPQQKATGAFMRLTADQDMTLLEAKSDAAAAVEIHEMAMKDDVMRMREVPKLALPAGKAVELKPGGYHIMLLDLKEQVKEGAQVPMSLVFEDANGARSTVALEIPVRSLAGAAPKHDHGSGHGGGHGTPATGAAGHGH